MSTVRAPLCSFRVLEPASRYYEHDQLKLLKARVSRAVKGYPELAGEVVNVGLMNDNNRTLGRADWYNNLIKFPKNGHVPTRITVWHEVAHIACHCASENGDDHAHTSEEFTSILAISRMPTELLDEDRIPYIDQDPEAPRELWPQICTAALDYREEHGRNSHYIKQCRNWLDNPSEFVNQRKRGEL